MSSCRRSTKHAFRMCSYAKTSQRRVINTLGGDRFTCTVGGKSPLGMHGHLLICDDPIDPKRAVSEAELRTAADFFDITLPGRKVNKAVSATILVQQRLHLQDPSGHLLERAKRDNAGKIRHINL